MGSTRDDLIECIICMDNVVPSYLVTCIACNTQSCQKCTRKYLLDSIHRAHCQNPSCRVEWDTTFLESQFPKSWLNGTKPGGYRHSRKKVLLEQQKAMIPETMVYVEEIKHQERIVFLRNYRTYLLDKYLKDIEHKLMFYENKIRYLNLTKPLNYEAKVQTCQTQMKEKRQAWTRTVGRPLVAQKLIPICGELGVEPAELEGGHRVKNHYQFICPCPVTDCRGLVEKKNGKCSVCETKICRKCRVPKLENHECDPDTLATITLMKQDSKPCPQCAIIITKTEGCDQMWCTQCQVAFSWESGLQDMGAIHNPHAIRWRREHGDLGRDIRDVPCGGFIYPLRNSRSYYEQSRVVKQLFNVDTHQQVDGAFMNLDRICQHEPMDRLRDVRVQFIRHAITEDQFENSVFRLTRAQEKKRRIRQIAQTVRDLAAERFRAYDESVITTETFYTELKELSEFFNSTMRMELKEFGKVYPQFRTGVNDKGEGFFYLER